MKISIGWIPELLSLHHAESNFDKDREFDRMFERFHAGHVLITVGKIYSSKTFVFFLNFLLFSDTEYV
jgi:hypothetical protein